MAAIEAGRYISQYGDALLNMLRGWAGDAQWVRAEVERLERLVTMSDAASLAALKQEINDSLVRTLREVQKDINRVQLSPPEGTDHPGFGSKAEEAPIEHTIAESSMRSGDIEEEAALQQAIAESMVEMSSELGLAGRTETPPLNAGCAEDAIGIGTTSSSEAATVPFCDHACDVVCNRQSKFRATCCHCACRELHGALLPGLDIWWRAHNICAPQAHGDQRFFCGTCSSRLGTADRNSPEALPVPFGGALLRINATGGFLIPAEKVQPIRIHTCKHGGDPHAVTNAGCNGIHDSASDAGSWVWLDSPSSDDEGCWEVVDALAALSMA
mmetsp:Transcript_24383/g.46809  ORF Transcript_24383/g.46809 Transcript_24383/m.46809 type:complete len:328 (+) Transcript_24383:2-985(+)